jgi:hypothetical protein
VLFLCAAATMLLVFPGNEALLEERYNSRINSLRILKSRPYVGALVAPARACP